MGQLPLSLVMPSQSVSVSVTVSVCYFTASLWLSSLWRRASFDMIGGFDDYLRLSRKKYQKEKGKGKIALYKAVMDSVVLNEAVTVQFVVDFVPLLVCSLPTRGFSLYKSTNYIHTDVVIHPLSR